jgi:membrane protease YdiL (CAAX protease family)
MHTLGNPAQRAPFFMLTLAITGATQAPAALSKLGLLSGTPEQYGGLVGIGLFGPMLAATICCYNESGRPGIRALYAQLLQWRASPVWYAAALFVPVLLLAVALFAMDPSGSRSYFYFPDIPPRFVALLLVPVVEELGWRGYALPRLLQRHSPLKASLILGFWWWAWHSAMFILQDFTAGQFFLYLLMLLAGSVVYTWLYLRSGGGVTIAVVLHASAHLSNPSLVLPADAVPALVYTALYCLVAAALVQFDRKTWRALGAPREREV